MKRSIVLSVGAIAALLAALSFELSGLMAKPVPREVVRGNQRQSEEKTTARAEERQQPRDIDSAKQAIIEKV